MADMIKILFYSRKSKANSEGLIPIYLRITVNGRRFEVATSKYVDDKLWSNESMTLIGKSTEAKEVNSFLDVLRSKALSIQKKLISKDTPVTVDTFAQEWHGIKPEPKMLLEIFKQHNEQVKALIGQQYSFATWSMLLHMITPCILYSISITSLILPLIRLSMAS